MDFIYIRAAPTTMTMIMVIRRSGEEYAEHVLDGPPTHRAGVRGAGARRADLKSIETKLKTRL